MLFLDVALCASHSNLWSIAFRAHPFSFANVLIIPCADIYGLEQRNCVMIGVLATFFILSVQL
jgi:hypothetical protein